MFAVGDPIEVEVVIPERPRMYMAGVVSFCRYIAGGYHEVGVELKAAGRAPIFSSDPAAAQETLDWLGEPSLKKQKD